MYCVKLLSQTTNEIYQTKSHIWPEFKRQKTNAPATTDKYKELRNGKK